MYTVHSLHTCYGQPYTGDNAIESIAKPLLLKRLDYGTDFPWPQIWHCPNLARERGGTGRECDLPKTLEAHFKDITVKVGALQLLLNKVLSMTESNVAVYYYIHHNTIILAQMGMCTAQNCYKTCVCTNNVEITSIVTQNQRMYIITVILHTLR
jgi:hypothetical protein